jgi:hypothetical protein
MVWGELESFNGETGDSERGKVFGMAWHHDGNFFSFLFHEHGRGSDKLWFSHDWHIDGFHWSPYLNMGFDFEVDVGDSMKDDE